LVIIKWVIQGVLATSGMLTMSDLDEIASGFKCVIPLVEEHEFEYDVDELRRRGVGVYHKPIVDFSAPGLIELHEIVELINRCEKPVLVHCSGGRGRSGVIAVAYLMATQGLDYYEALWRARSVEPKYVETPIQHQALRLYSKLLRAVPRRLLREAIELGRRISEEYGCAYFGRGVGHASRVLELSIKLAEELERVGVVKLNDGVKRALYVAAILHDVGVTLLKPGEPDDLHREYSYMLIRQHAHILNEACSCDVGERAALIARLHGARDPIPPGLDREEVVAIGVLRVADGLDYTLKQHIYDVEVERSGSRLEIKAYCGEAPLDACEVCIEKANKKKALLEEALGLDITVAPALS
jgi:protein tyrosine phosphatase (PTP) superfamily phosphohydrolase (DUF442 family)